MGRVSLTEAYDDRSVIAKLNEMDKRVKENTTVVTSAEASAKASAQAAQETADRFAGSVGAVVQNANAQINASKAQVDQAKAEVDETVTTVAQAVQTANNASASAQQSATTVEGYDTRLTAAESKNDQQDTAISELQTADSQNVKIGTPQNITGRKTIFENYPRLDFKSKVATDAGSGLRLLDTTDGSQKQYLYLYPDRIDIPTPVQGASSSAIVNKAYVESTDGVTNNLVHRSTNETVTGQKNSAFTYNNFYEVDAFTASRAGWHCIYDIGNQARWIGELVLARISNANFAYRASKSSFEVCIETSTSAFLKKNYVHGTTPSVKLCHDGNGWHILVKCPEYLRTFTRLDTESYTWNAGDSTFKVSANADAVVTEPSAEQYDTIIDVTEW